MDETLPPLPDALLYYGEILDIRRDDRGNPTQLQMESPRDGAYGMNLGEETYYVNSGERKSFPPANLQPGDRVYVFHSPMTARTLPPQSPAFVILNKIPLDASCGMYHRAEKLEQKDGAVLMTTDGGKKLLSFDAATTFLSYSGEETDGSLLRENDYVIAWYWDRGEDILHASHVMLLGKP